MASRRETMQRKQNLRADLRSACQNGTLAQGEPVPPVRELVERYGVSLNTVRETLRVLIDEGLLYTVPRVGTFVGRPTATEPELYLMLQPENARRSGDPYYLQLQSGFEERIALLGGTSMTMFLETALACQAGGSLPRPAGIFDFAFRPEHPDPSWGRQLGLPRVAYEGWVEDPLESDIVAFDNVAAGRQVTEHLLSLGHRRIAYLATHTATGYPGQFTYSVDREQGWREALTGASLTADGLVFHPLALPTANHAERVEATRAVARALVIRPDVTAVVTADSRVTRGLFLCLGDLEFPPERWPAVVGFGNGHEKDNAFVTAMRLPWDEIGGAAADLLWERSCQRLTGSPVTRRIPMRLIPRLTSRPGWATGANPALIAAAVSETGVRSGAEVVPG